MANTSIKNAFERMWYHIVAALGNKVDLTTEETISGVKTFSNGMNIGDAQLKYNSTDKAIEISFK